MQKTQVKCVLRCPYNCCRLCLGVRRGSASELPLTGLRTLLYIGQDETLRYMLDNTTECTQAQRVDASAHTTGHLLLKSDLFFVWLFRFHVHMWPVCRLWCEQLTLLKRPKLIEN